MSHSVRADTASTSVPPSRAFVGVTSPAWLPSEALGVGHIPFRAIVSSDGRTAAPGLALWFVPPELAAGVGNHEDPVTSVRGANGCRRNAVPLRVIPARGQVSENSLKPPNKERCHVLNKHVPGSNLPNDPGVLSPQSRLFPVNSSAESCCADVLAREPSAEHVTGREVVGADGSHVVEAGDVGPMLREDLGRIRVTLHMKHGCHAGALEAEL